jgi:molecular chaperone GrpE
VAENEIETEAEVIEEASLEAQLEAAQKKAEENWELVLRTQADMENLRKRTSRDIENAHKYGLEKIANELLAVRDSMELGLGAAQEDVDVKSLREGAELTLKMLVQVMEKFGIKQVDPEKQKFNPDLHQAMTMQESDELEPNTVIAVMQKGYTLNERLLRPALVTVSKAPAKKTEK